MEELNYEGGFRQISKRFIHQHNVNFAVIVDALGYIYRENIEQGKFVKINNEKAVMISNDFLSRHTALGLSAIKGNIKNIEELGLVSVLKKGQGNIRHYVVHIDRINQYERSLKKTFEAWFEKSLKSSKNDMSRSNKADQIKLDASIRNFLETMAWFNDGKVNELDQNQPTKEDEICELNKSEPTVVDTALDTALDTAKDTNSSKPNHLSEMPLNSRDKKFDKDAKSKPITLKTIENMLLLFNTSNEINEWHVHTVLKNFIPDNIGSNWKMSEQDKGYIKINLKYSDHGFTQAVIDYIELNVERMVSGEREMRFGSILGGIERKVLEAGIGYEDVEPRITKKEYQKELANTPKEEHFDFDDHL